MTKNTNGRTIAKLGFEQVNKIPRSPELQSAYWLNSPNGKRRYTHHLFRYPAKFHPPVVEWALGLYGRKGSWVADPYNGSGTVQVESLLRGINSVGIDIDPLACLIAQVKITPISAKRLDKAYQDLLDALDCFTREPRIEESIGGADISEEQFQREIDGLWIPDIDNISHWFRRYVIVDLARIFDAIESSSKRQDILKFLQTCAASIIRRVSNADPHPVSGLEVTSVQAKLNKTRKINVYREFFTKLAKEVTQMKMFWSELKLSGRLDSVHRYVINANILDAAESLKSLGFENNDIPLIITSPPYCSAVEYSRRHRLEMFWLRLVDTIDEHISLRHQYIGRRYVRVREWEAPESFGISGLDETLGKISNSSNEASRTLSQYFYQMERAVGQIRKIIRSGGTFVCVIGDSRSQGIEISTTDYLIELAADYFTLKSRFSYAIRNHHMQYGLWNGDGIKTENVLVFKPKK